MIDELIAYNRTFVENKGYEPYRTDKYPSKEIAIVACMDTRLIELLPAALGVKNGDVKLIRNAGGMVSQPFGDTMRSLLVAVYELGVKEIMIVGHTDCGVKGMDGAEMLRHMEAHGIPKERIRLMEACGIDLQGWLSGFDDTAEAVRESLRRVRSHPLIPSGITVRGFIMDSVTGKVEEVKE